MNNSMKVWLREQGISYRQLASEMNQSPASISLKVNGKVGWNREDLSFLNHYYGLSSDFVLGFLAAATKEACP